MTNQPVPQPETPKPAVPARSRMPSFLDLREEMDRLWESMMGSSFRPFRGLTRMTAFPALEVYEEGDQLKIRAELPGMTEKDVEISVTEEALMISGEKKEEREVKEENYYRSERTYGKFNRQVALPPGADADNATARFKDGVLEIDVPVRPAPPTEAKKTIPIQPGG